jgi:cellulose synthase/poly-beta-1,6-N-acetylglucosamine synthase-like glycosyltransferase
MDFSIWLAPLTSVLGLSVLFWRLGPVMSFAREPEAVGELAGIPADDDTVSIVIPARNEERNLPMLLDSVMRLDWAALEVVVVDDESTDRTAEIVESYAALETGPRIRLVRGKPKPEGWTGKNWACHQGFEASTGKWVLFTDADTAHEPDSLRLAMRRMREHRLDLLTAAPYHRCETFWEKLMGPFHLFLLLGTAAFSEPKPGRVFAIGQYLLFRKDAYLRQGGHERVKDVLCDDLELARHCLESGGRYRVEGRSRLYQVRMYDRFTDFVNGWRRIFRLGFRHARISSSIEIYLVIAALTAGLQFFLADHLTIGLMVLSAGIFALIQSRFGNFSIFGVLLLPLSLALFFVVSLLALFDLVIGRSYVWRGRSYQKTSD